MRTFFAATMIICGVVIASPEFDIYNRQTWQFTPGDYWVEHEINSVSVYAHATCKGSNEQLLHTIRVSVPAGGDPSAAQKKMIYEQLVMHFQTLCQS